MADDLSAAEGVSAGGKIMALDLSAAEGVPAGGKDMVLDSSAAGGVPSGGSVRVEKGFERGAENFAAGGSSDGDGLELELVAHVDGVEKTP